jgi:hypothetical protein
MTEWLVLVEEILEMIPAAIQQRHQRRLFLAKCGIEYPCTSRSKTRLHGMDPRTGKACGAHVVLF